MSQYPLLLSTNGSQKFRAHKSWLPPSHSCVAEIASLCLTHQSHFYSSSFYVRGLTSFLGQSTMWGGTGLSWCLFIFREFVRMIYFERIYTDNSFVLAAWVMLLAGSTSWQYQQILLYKSFRLSALQIKPTVDSLEAPILPIKRQDLNCRTLPQARSLGTKIKDSMVVRHGLYYLVTSTSMM